MYEIYVYDENGIRGHLTMKAYNEEDQKLILQKLLTLDLGRTQIFKVTEVIEELKPPQDS